MVAEELADIGRVARADSDRLVCLCLPIFGIRPPGRVLGAGRGLLSVFRQDESGRAEFALGGSAAALIVSHLLRARITYATECTASRKFKGFVRLAFQRNKFKGLCLESCLIDFLTGGWFDEALFRVSNRKQATVYCCYAYRWTRLDLLVAEVGRLRRQCAMRNYHACSETKQVGQWTGAFNNRL